MGTKCILLLFQQFSIINKWKWCYWITRKVNLSLFSHDLSTNICIVSKRMLWLFVMKLSLCCASASHWVDGILISGSDILRILSIKSKLIINCIKSESFEKKREKTVHPNMNTYPQKHVSFAKFYIYYKQILQFANK